MTRLTLIPALILMMMFSLTVTDQAHGQQKIAYPDIVVEVDGLACPFCAYGLEKKLKKLEGVEAIHIDVDKGITDIKLKEGQTLSEEKIKDAVEKAGFTIRDIKYPDKQSGR